MAISLITHNVNALGKSTDVQDNQSSNSELSFNSPFASTYTLLPVNTNFLIKLNQSNFLLWRKQLVSLISAYGLEKIIDLVCAIPL